jgi:hypothetical protein
MEPSEEAKAFVKASMDAWMKGEPLPEVPASAPMTSMVPLARESAPLASPQVMGAREVMALGHLAVGASKSIGGVVVLKRLDVTTFAILGERSDTSRELEEMKSYAARLEAYVSELEEALTAPAPASPTSDRESAVAQACEKIGETEIIPEVKPEGGDDPSDTSSAV